MFGNFILKKLLASKMKDVPEAEREKLLEVIEKNPKLFEAIALKAKSKMDQGKGQMDAIMEAAREHEAELKDALK